VADYEAGQRLWRLELACGHTQEVWTFVGDFDYAASHFGLPEVCSECPVGQHLTELVSVTLLPIEEWSDSE
jgi:hypothetical protein